MTFNSTPQPSVLLVEDSDDDAYFFRRTFQKSGAAFPVRHVLNGALAVEFLKQAETTNSLPAIIFLDLKMPIMNGFDVLAWIRNQSFASRLPVVVLSGSEQQKDRERAMQLGAKDYLVKPLTNDSLAAHLSGLAAQTNALKQNESPA